MKLPSECAAGEALLAEEDFSLHFLNARGSVAAWRETVGQALGASGCLVQQRVVAPRASAAAVYEDLRRAGVGREWADPLVVAGPDDWPVQFSGVACVCRGGRARLGRHGGGFLLSGGGGALFFGMPVTVPAGHGDDGFRGAFENMGRQAERAGMAADTLVRTWLLVEDIERDYRLLNDRRREYFDSCGISGVGPYPASTGVQGCAYPPGGLSVQGWYASGGGMRVEGVASPLQREPSEYGVLFSRALALHFQAHRLLFVSGTAAIDGAGRSILADDCAGQIGYALDVVLALIAGQGGALDDIAHAVVYVKEPRHAQLCLERAVHAGVPAQRCVVQVAAICRPELLCEIEAHAVLPRPGGPKRRLPPEAAGNSANAGGKHA